MEKVMIDVPLELDEARLQASSAAAVDAFFRIHGAERAPC